MGEGREKVLRYEPATLQNLDGGGMEDEFQAALTRVTEMFAEPGRFVVKNDQVKATVELKVELVRDVRTGAMDLSYRVAVKPPAARMFDSSVYLEDGEILVDVSKQLELGEEPEEGSGVTPLRPRAAEGEDENGA